MLFKLILLILTHTVYCIQTKKSHKYSKFAGNRWILQNQVHGYALKYIFTISRLLLKTHTTKLTAHIPNISTKFHCLDKPEWSVSAGICGHPPSLFRKKKREQIGNSQFLFPDCLTKKELKCAGSFQYFPGNERTLSTDSARSFACNAPQSKRHETQTRN